MGWFIILAALFVAVVLALAYFDLLFKVLFIVILAAVIIIGVKLMLRKYEPFESALIYRLGKFNRASSGGWTWVIPGLERIGAVVDMREQQEHIDIPVITNEGLEVSLYGLAYFFVNNSKKVVLNVKNYRSALHDLIESRVRDIAGEFSFTEIIVNIEKILEVILADMAPSLERWGVTVTNLQLQRVEPPRQVMKAIKEKRISREQLEAKKFAAEARRVVINALGAGTQNFNDKTISYLYIKALENMKAAKMMFPAEFMDVMKDSGGGGAGKSLAKGLIAGETFEKALDMVGSEIEKEASVKKGEIKKKLEKLNEVAAVASETMGH